MAEKPIKLFATRAERYPEPGDADIAEAAARAGLNLIPVVGGPINEVLSLILSPAIARRRDEWFKDIANDIDRLEEEVRGIKEKLKDNEAFISATVQATRIALSTHEQEKRKMLRNALLKIASHKAPGEELQQIFLNAIDAFSVSHVKVLKVLWTGMQDLIQKGLWKAGGTAIIPTYDGVFALLLPELKGRQNLVQLILTDLRIRGFSNLTGLDVPFPNTTMITNLGIEFMHFIMEPDPQK